MGHCDNPTCKEPGPLQVWETNEINFVINGVVARVHRYCNTCLYSIMGQADTVFPHPLPIIEHPAGLDGMPILSKDSPPILSPLSPQPKL